MEEEKKWEEVVEQLEELTQCEESCVILLGSSKECAYGLVRGRNEELVYAVYNMYTRDPNVFFLLKRIFGLVEIAKKDDEVIGSLE